MENKFKLGDKVVFLYGLTKTVSEPVIPSWYCQVGEIAAVNVDDTVAYDINTGPDVYTFKGIEEKYIAAYSEAAQQYAQARITYYAKNINLLWNSYMTELARLLNEGCKLTKYIGFYMTKAGVVNNTPIFDTYEEAEKAARVGENVLGDIFIEVKEMTVDFNNIKQN